jgi:hypothetical protein
MGHAEFISLRESARWAMAIHVGRFLGLGSQSGPGGSDVSIIATGTHSEKVFLFFGSKTSVNPRCRAICSQAIAHQEKIQCRPNR